jgi:hypothetical protein
MRGCNLELYERRSGGGLRTLRGPAETNIELLRGLPVDAGSRKAKHRAAGEITLSQILHEWPLRDLGARAADRGAGAGAGPLGEDYQLKP